MPLDYVFYTSLTLVIMGALTAILAFTFHHKNHNLKQLPPNLKPSIYNKTYAIFNPYPTERKMIHSFLLALPLVVAAMTFGVFLLGLEIVKSGLTLGLITTIVALNMILVEEAPEIYTNSRIFHKAIQTKAELAPGDIKTLQLIKQTTKKLANYYTALTVFFIACAAILPYIITQAFQSFISYLDFVAQASEWAGILAWQVSAILIAVSYILILLVASQVKGRIFKYNIQ